MNNKKIVEIEKISRPGLDSPLINGHVRVRITDDSPSPIMRRTHSPDYLPGVRLNQSYAYSPSRGLNNSNSSMTVPELNPGDLILNGIQPRIMVTPFVSPPMVTPPRVTPGSISSDPLPIGMIPRLPPGRLHEGSFEYYSRFANYREQTLFDIKRLRNERVFCEEVIETVGTNEQISILDKTFEGFLTLIDSFN